MPEGLHLALGALWLSSAFGALVTPLPYPVSLVIWMMHCAGSLVLFADGLHRYLKSHCSEEGVHLDGGDRVSTLGYADDFVLLADTVEGLQRLIDAAAEFCAAVGMAINVPKTKAMVFSGSTLR